ncbi:SCAN domain-containing protein 3 [Trichonephila clavipes]|nr:SCAN domain-containing protein 3 [Trichonephila clavipes]
MEFLKNRKDFFKDLRLDTALNEMLCDAREFPDKIDIPANFELTQPRHRIRRRNVNCNYEAREDPTFKYKAEFYFFTLDKAINALESSCTGDFKAVHCMSVKKSISKKKIICPIVSRDFNYRGQVDLVDLQSTPDRNYKWLLHYQDHKMKFSFLRPLTSKRATEVALELLKIFLEVGCPRILQSDNGRLFTATVIQKLKNMWPTCKIVNDRPRHPASQGSVERSNQDFEAMLREWLIDNNTKTWALGCYFVQFQKNSSFHRTIKRSPYKALFGSEPKIGLQSSHISKELLEKLVTEKDLDLLLNQQEHDITSTPEDLPVISLKNNNDASKYLLAPELIDYNASTSNNLSVPELIDCNASTSKDLLAPEFINYTASASKDLLAPEFINYIASVSKDLLAPELINYTASASKDQLAPEL